MENDKSSVDNKNKFSLSLDLRLVVIALLVVIAGMLLLWQPWSTDTDRTISVTGEATVSAEPDEYVFSPTYQFKNEDQDAALATMTERSEEIVDGLKELGVEDSQIKTNSDGYDFPVYREPDAQQSTYTLRLMVTIDDKELAQNVQDYLVNTSPTGSVTPYVTFSDDKQKELENQARDQATQDARAKAEQSAGNLGASLGSVKEVSDDSGFDAIPFRGGGLDASSASEADTLELSLQPGENELNYSVTVVYYLR